MKSKGHVGGIIDRRFGENNPNLTPEEKMLERFTREKQVRMNDSNLLGKTLNMDCIIESCQSYDILVQSRRR